MILYCLAIRLQSLAQEVKQALQDMQEALKRFSAEDGEKMQANPDWYLEIGKGYMAAGEWKKAAMHFDKYIQYDLSNWEVHFSRARSERVVRRIIAQTKHICVQKIGYMFK